MTSVMNYMCQIKDAFELPATCLPPSLRPSRCLSTVIAERARSRKGTPPETSNFATTTTATIAHSHTFHRGKPSHSGRMINDSPQARKLWKFWHSCQEAKKAFSRFQFQQSIISAREMSMTEEEEMYCYTEKLAKGRSTQNNKGKGVMFDVRVEPNSL